MSDDRLSPLRSSLQLPRMPSEPSRNAASEPLLPTSARRPQPEPGRHSRNLSVTESLRRVMAQRSVRAGTSKGPTSSDSDSEGSSDDSSDEKDGLSRNSSPLRTFQHRLRWNPHLAVPVITTPNGEERILRPGATRGSRRRRHQDAYFVPDDPFNVHFHPHFPFMFRNSDRVPGPPKTPTNTAPPSATETRGQSPVQIDHSRDRAMLWCLPLPISTRTSSKIKSRFGFPPKPVTPPSNGFPFPPPLPERPVATEEGSKHPPPPEVPVQTATLLTTFTDTIPRQLYTLFLLLLPSLYFSRVARIFQDAEISRPEIQKMIDVFCESEDEREDEGPANAAGHEGGDSEDRRPSHESETPLGAIFETGLGLHLTPPTLPKPHLSPNHTPLAILTDDDLPPDVILSPALTRFSHSWSAFIDSLIREWKTLNIISALLLSAILTVLQIPLAATDPPIRTAALLSLICAVMSLVYGCTFIVRFASMRSLHRASLWAEEARQTYTNIFWNVWVFLAMPVVWLAWSMICFLSAVMLFVWRSGATNEPETTESVPGLSPKKEIGPRVAVTLVLMLGIVYYALIIGTLKRYGARRPMKSKESRDAERTAEEEQGLLDAQKELEKESRRKASERKSREKKRKGKDSRKKGKRHGHGHREELHTMSSPEQRTKELEV